MEPIHNSPREAISWVNENTDNALFRAGDDIIRVEAGPECVSVLRPASDGTYYWERARSVN